MVEIICGAKGKGKTKKMLEYANESVTKAQGEVIYLDKSGKNIYELNNQIRLINIKEYPVSSKEGFIGFIAGLLSGNNDIECIFLDSFLKVAYVEEADVVDALETLESINNSVKFVLSISMEEDSIPDSLKDKILHSC